MAKPLDDFIPGISARRNLRNELSDLRGKLPGLQKEVKIAGDHFVEVWQGLKKETEAGLKTDLTIDKNGTATLQIKKTELPAVFVRIQNVHDYFYEHYKEHGWDDLDSFFCARPPFKEMVLAYDHDFKKYENQEPGSQESTLVVRHTDIRVTELTIAEFLQKSSMTKSQVALSDYGVLETGGDKVVEFINAVSPDIAIQIEISSDGSLLPGRWFCFADKMGKVKTLNGLGFIFLVTPKDFSTFKHAVNSKETFHRYENFFCRCGSLALAAIQFMNCKNVEIIDNPPSRQQRRAAERVGQKPPVSYKTLIIHPVGHRNKSATNRSSEPSGSMALHIVRGHFKDYTTGEGLGRYHVKGVYWWSPQVRGSVERGRVEKDYEVETGQR